MDMKRILQALDGASSKPVEGANDMKKFLSVITEGANPHKVTLPVQMAMNHYQKPKEPVVIKKQSSGISKYFHKVEEEIAEQTTQKRQVLNQYAQTVAERVMMKEAANPAQQAAIAIAKKKKKGVAEGKKPEHNLGPGWMLDKDKALGQKVDQARARYSELYKTTQRVDPRTGKKIVQKGVAEGEIPGHSMGFTGGVGPGMGNYVVDEAPLDFDKNSPMSSTIHSHKGVNPASIETRIMRARRQLQELAKMAELDDPLAWQHIARLFPELAMNVEQIDHGLRQLGSIRQKGGRNSKNIPPHLDPDVNETVLNPIKPKVASAPKAIKPKSKTSTCRAGQTQTGMQIKNGKSVPKCSVTGIKK